MDRKKYSSQLSNTSWKNKISLIINLSLAVSILILLIILVQTKTSVQTILLPPTVNRPMSVNGDEMDKVYAEEMSRYFSQLYLTYTSKNVKSQFDIILANVDASIHADYKAILHSDAKRIARNSMSSVFQLLNLEAEQLKNGDYRVIVGGELLSMVGTHIVSNDIAYFEFVLSFKGGQLSIVSFNKMKKTSENNEDVFIREKSSSEDTGDHDEIN